MPRDELQIHRLDEYYYRILQSGSDACTEYGTCGRAGLRIPVGVAAYSRAAEGGSHL